MLTMLLSGALLVGVSPVSPALELHLLAPQRSEVTLCFQGAGHLVRFELLLLSSGPAGRSRSRQKGQVQTTAEPVCPVKSQLAAPASSQIEARLRWWMDGIEQTAESRSIRLE